MSSKVCFCGGDGSTSFGGLHGPGLGRNTTETLQITRECKDEEEIGAGNLARGPGLCALVWNLEVQNRSKSLSGSQTHKLAA